MIRILKPSTIKCVPSLSCRSLSYYGGLRQNAAAAVASRTEHPGPISASKLMDLEERYNEMSKEEQSELVSLMKERMKAPWTELTKVEKAAAYYIAYGNHGPRALQDFEKPGFHTSVGLWTLGGIVLGLGLYAGWRVFLAPPPVVTMNTEWQKAANERLKEHNSDPITGISSEGYKGPGQITSIFRK